MTVLHAWGTILLLWAFWATICISATAFVRRWTDPPLEVLTRIVLWSLAIAGFSAFAAYVCGARLELVGYLLIVLGCVGLILRRTEMLRLLSDRDIRRSLAALLFVQLSTLCAVAAIRCYSGADWYWDWFEHYQRSRLFAEHWPPETHFGACPMTARPPLGNALSALALAVFGSEFFNYQISMAFFSGLLLFPVLLIARVLLHGCSSVAVGLALLVNPMFMQNASFPWTKHLAALYILQAVFEVTRDGGELDLQQSSRAFCWLAIACMVHYSAVPWSLGAVLLITVSRRESCGLNLCRMRNLVVPMCLFGLICSPWFVWSLIRFGFADTLFSNSAVIDARGHSISEHFVRICGNIGRTLMPLGVPWGTAGGDSFLLRLREIAFCLFQLNLVFAFGSVLWIRVGAAGFGKLFRGADRHRLSLFRAAVLVVVLSIGTVGGSYGSGLAHIGLQPLVLIGVAAAPYVYYASSPIWRRLLLTGAALDFLCGVALHFAFQRELLANANLELKNTLSLLFAGDLPGAFETAFFAAALAGAYCCLSAMRADPSRPPPIQKSISPR